MHNSTDSIASLLLFAVLCCFTTIHFLLYNAEATIGALIVVVLFVSTSRDHHMMQNLFLSLMRASTITLSHQNTLMHHHRLLLKLPQLLLMNTLAHPPFLEKVCLPSHLRIPKRRKQIGVQNLNSGMIGHWNQLKPI